MNLSLSNGSGDHPMEPEDCDLQGDIDEHIEIMTGADPSKIGYTGRVMLLSDPEYPGAYRVWIERKRIPGTRYQTPPMWVWVTPEGQAITSSKPWGVTA